MEREENGDSNKDMQALQIENEKIPSILKKAPKVRRKVTSIKDVDPLAEYKHATMTCQFITCAMGIFWLSNSVFGFYIAEGDYHDYLENNYPSLRFYILIFSLKWVTSVGLALAIILIATLMQAIKCFTGSATELKQHVKQIIMPSYLVCVLVQQAFAFCYGVWFFV